MTEVETIAKSLTKAQRVAIARLTHEWALAPYDGWRRTGQACTMLCGKDLARARIIKRKAEYRLTLLGIQVRTHLSEVQS